MVGVKVSTQGNLVFFVGMDGTDGFLKILIDQ